jgi:hypothetical protein
VNSFPIMFLRFAQFSYLAEKYKLYKKLSKAAATAAETQPGAPPSTPQKRDSRPLLLLSKPRVVEPTAPLALYNPFSPVKSKAKQKHTSTRPPEDFRRSNIFASPSKLGKPKLVDSREPSPDVLPEILLFQPIASSSAQLHPPAENAVSRARKRLRGEPVSPSPNKEKRRRVGSSQTSLPFAKLGASAPAIDGDDDDLDVAGEANSSFVDDSPVKVPAGGKSFKLLFEESLPKNGASKRKSSLSRSKTTSASVGLFGDRAASGGTLVGAGADQDLGAIVEGGVNQAKSDHPKNGIAVTPAVSASGWLPGKDDLFSEGIAPPYENIQKPETRRHSPLESEARKAAKRSLSDAEDNTEGDRRKTQSLHITAPKLLPPSPPAESSLRGSSSNFRGKGKAGSRKKVKVQEEVDEEEDDESMDERMVRRIRRIAQKPSADDPDFDFDSDAVLAPKGHRGSRDPQPVSQVQDDSASPNYPDSETGRFEVDLPDKLRRVLAFSHSSKSRESKAERVVRGLLSGRRATHYDPVKGGEIWDVGEEDQIRGDTEGEDDWEGEGVPWEVGEL